MNYEMKFNEYENLAPLEKLTLWFDMPVEYIKKFCEYDYKLKRIAELRNE